MTNRQAQRAERAQAVVRLVQHERMRQPVICSMTDGCDCYQNELAERGKGILKTEFLLHRPADPHQARRMVQESVQIYRASLAGEFRL